ncbi:MAG: DUF421 domain-containing protein [Candidatus Limivicinus sp.]
MAIVIIRTLIIYFALLVTIRFLGKRQLGEMELSEFVVAVLIADLAAHPLQDIGIPMINGLVPILVLFCCEVFIAFLSMKCIRFRAVLFGKPSIIIDHGVINQQEMHKNRFTADELMQELRGQSCQDISEVEYAILETDGQLSVIKYPLERPVTAGQMKLDADDGGYPVIIISNGRLLEKNLHHLSLDEKWLRDQLDRRNIRGVKNVFLMTVNESQEIYIAEKEAPK